MANGQTFATSLIQDRKYPKFNERFGMTWNVEIGNISFTGIEVDTFFDDVVFSKSIDASRFKGYEELSGTLYNNGKFLDDKVFFITKYISLPIVK